MYAELSYFDGYHFQHIAAWQEEQRLRRYRKFARELQESRCIGWNYRLGVASQR